MIKNFRSDKFYSKFNPGDFVIVYPYSPHDKELACTPAMNGIFLDYDEESYEAGWIVLADGEKMTLTKRWWRLEKYD